jgi:hypothetical protein
MKSIAQQKHKNISAAGRCTVHRKLHSVEPSQRHDQASAGERSVTYHESFGPKGLILIIWMLPQNKNVDIDSHQYSKSNGHNSVKPPVCIDERHVCKDRSAVMSSQALAQGPDKADETSIDELFHFSPNTPLTSPSTGKEIDVTPPGSSILVIAFLSRVDVSLQLSRCV